MKNGKIRTSRASQTAGADEPIADFMKRRNRENPEIVQASGIESPGLTCCLAVGHLVRDLVCKVPPRRSFKK
jgi:hypothetical protein